MIRSLDLPWASNTLRPALGLYIVCRFADKYKLSTYSFIIADVISWPLKPYQNPNHIASQRLKFLVH